MIQTSILLSPKGEPLSQNGEGLVTASGSTYPVIDGVPILLDGERSLFTPGEVVQRQYVEEKVSRVRGVVRRVLPGMSLSIGTRERYAEFARRIGQGRVLVIGGGLLGNGAEPLIDSALEVVESDVYLSPRVDVVCDGHDLPFGDSTFDGVVLQAVLEHVLDPPRVVAEAHRVLRQGGLVYAETPFLQAVHEGPFDFTRWTELGHRRLFNMFGEIDSGVLAGPATTLLWAICYFARSLPRRGSRLPLILEKLAVLTFFWLKHLDHILIKHPGATDAASAVYFLGEKAERPVDDREILASYGGAIGRPVRREGSQ